MKISLEFNQRKYVDFAIGKSVENDDWAEDLGVPYFQTNPFRGVDGA